MSALVGETTVGSPRLPEPAKVRCCLRHRWDVVLVAGILFEMWADPRGVAVVAAARVGMAVVVCVVPLPRLIRVVGAYDL